MSEPEASDGKQSGDDGHTMAEMLRAIRNNDL
jgi:hypothetical protein